MKHSSKPTMSLRWWAFSTTVIAITGAMGLLFVLTQLYPSPTTKFLLYILLFITFGAGAIPVSAYLNYRFASRQWRQRDPKRLIRQGFEAGLLMVLLAYLQLLPALDWTIAAVLFGVFILMETFFLTRH